MKKMILAALMVMSASAQAQLVTAGKENETVNLSFNSIHDLRGNEVQVAASTVCLDGKLFAVAVQKDSTGKTSGGVALTQIMYSNNSGKMYHVDCRSNKK